MNFRATPKQALQALAAGFLCGALAFLAYRLLCGAPPESLSFLRILGICLAGPLLEEGVFRGLAFRPAQQYLGSKGAVLLCAALFGFAHWGIPNSFIAFAAGLVFGYIRVKDDSILSPILAHMSANIVLLILQTVI